MDTYSIQKRESPRTEFRPSYELKRARDSGDNLSLKDSNGNPTTKDLKQTNDITGESLGVEKKLKEAWFKEFGLKSIDEYFIPQFSNVIKEVLNKAGIAQDFHLKLGSLKKLETKQREEFLPYIKPTLQEPNLILDNGKGILFIKEFVDSDKNRYFMSVVKDF